MVAHGRMGYHFISYSAVDAEGFAARLVHELAAGFPPIAVWLDKRELKPGLDWDEQISRAIKECDSLLFVMTRDSVMSQSVCKREWTRALKHNKPVIPLRLHADAELPFLLEPRQYIDFSTDFAAALKHLRGHLLWLSEPAGVLQTLKDRLADATRALSRSPEQDRPRVLEEIAALERQIAQQERVVHDPNATLLLSRRREDRQANQPAVERRRMPAGAPVTESKERQEKKAWDPAVLERATRDLAVYIGPMARVLVGRAAESAPSIAELYEALAAEIVSPADRQKFLASRPR
jgi:hypothetical protein